MELPHVPSTLPFQRWGLVPSVCILIGVPAALLGLLGEVSLSNRRLTLGGTLVSFAVTWFYGRRAWTRRSVLECLKCALFLVLTMAAGYCLAFGKLPSRIW